MRSPQFIFLSTPATNVRDDVLSILVWSVGTLPMQYLGLPVFYGKLKEDWCQPLLDKVDKHHAKWKASILSCAGRICLLKHVLQRVVNYWMTVFALPRKIINKLNSSVAAFLWAVGESSKGQHHIAWGTSCTLILKEALA
ncbi:putative ribonuclease H protein [Nymphaea thermarum]|nr:putative ribonuclease H protein [Nymphaea thermarum]